MNDYQRLLDNLGTHERLAVAFSGGADSTLVLKAAIDALGCENVLALTAATVLHSEDEIVKAKQQCVDFDVQHEVLRLDPLEDEKIRSNSKKRCYYCKHAIFTKLIQKASDSGFDQLAEGSNIDDKNVYRPGKQAISELGVFSPLAECELTKLQIRTILKGLGLSVASKPARPCLATRFPYDMVITSDMLMRVQEGEKILKSLGLSDVRLRHHGDFARIEVLKSEFLKVINNQEMVNELKSLGYKYITLDLEGFRSGSFDE